MMQLGYAVLLVSLAVIFWLLNFFSLPGNWLIVAAAALYAWLMPGDSAYAIGWGTVGAVVLLAVAGEIVELLSGAAHAGRAGGSTRGKWLSLIGAIAGGMAGIFVGIPIPIIGSFLGALLFAPIGALVGAVLGEHSLGRDMADSWRIGKAAFWGRLYGTLAKASIGLGMVVAIVAGLLF